VTHGEFSQDALADPVWGCWLVGPVGKQAVLAAVNKPEFRNATVVAESLFPMAEQGDRQRRKILTVQVRTT